MNPRVCRVHTWAVAVFEVWPRRIVAIPASYRSRQFFAVWTFRLWLFWKMWPSFHWHQDYDHTNCYMTSSYTIAYFCIINNLVCHEVKVLVILFPCPFPATIHRNERVIVTPKRRFDVIITCILRFVFAGLWFIMILSYVYKHSCDICESYHTAGIWVYGSASTVIVCEHVSSLTLGLCSFLKFRRPC